jgi:hypothetical protein
MTAAAIDARAGLLLAEAARAYEALWDDAVAMVRYPEAAAHDPRGTLAYAIVLLRRGDAAARQRAGRAIRAVLALQERDPGDAHYGNFRWTLEESVLRDLNGVEFMLDNLTEILRAHEDALAADLAEDIREAIALGLDEIDRLDVHPGYTNIALSDISNSVLGGRAIGDGSFVERGARRLDDWLAFTNRSGAPHEYNSPTYCAVDLQRLAALAEHAPDPALALAARVAEERLWQHVAAHYHPGLAQIAGPHARAYYDGVTGAGGYLKLLLWRLLGDPALRPEAPYGAPTREEMHVAVALDTLHPPAAALGWLREKRYPFQVIETVEAARGADITTYMTADYTLGTASCGYAVGDPPEPSRQQNALLLQFRRDAVPGFGSLFARYLSDDRDREAAASADLWDEGTPVAAQSRSRAIVAYGLTPRLRAAASYRLSVRMLGVGSETQIWCGDRRIDAFPAAVEPGEPVVVAEGGVFVALVPLEPDDMGRGAPIALDLRGHMLTLDIYNYRGPAKAFWEYQSLGGAFFKRNVRNAFAMEVAGRCDFADADAFRRHVAAARIADSTGDDGVREIAYASEGGSVTLRYSLRDMRTLARVLDGAPHVAAMARGGAIDGGGLQWIQSRDVLIELGGAKLMAGTAPKWLCADDDRRRYVVVNPSGDEAPLWLETPGVTVECDAFGFGRVEIDGSAGTVEVEAAGEIAPIRISGAATLRLAINGADVTHALVPVAADTREFRGL